MSEAERRVLSRGLLAAALLLPLIAFAVDYGGWQRQTRRFAALASPFASRIGSIGGWPVGREIRCSVDGPTPRSNRDIERFLEGVRTRPRNHVVLVRYDAGTLTPGQVRWIERELAELGPEHWIRLKD